MEWIKLWSKIRSWTNLRKFVRREFEDKRNWLIKQANELKKNVKISSTISRNYHKIQIILPVALKIPRKRDHLAREPEYEYRKEKGNFRQIFGRFSAKTWSPNRKSSYLLFTLVCPFCSEHSREHAAMMRMGILGFTIQR